MSIPEKSDPIELFSEWFSEAQQCAALSEPTSMTLATVDEDGQPWTRVVLLKGHDERGFAFFTNTRSLKGEHLAHNPKAALNFYWMPLDKQVRVIGEAERVPDEEADAYFARRPRGSQLGAWASHQSEPLAGREDLERRLREFTEKYEGEDVPRPPHWTGYRVAPRLIEFWLKAPDRLHYRRAYIRQPDGSWKQEWLNP